MASTVGTLLYKISHFEGFFYEIVTFLSSLYQYVGHRYIKIPMNCLFYKFRIISFLFVKDT